MFPWPLQVLKVCVWEGHLAIIKTTNKTKNTPIVIGVNCIAQEAPLVNGIDKNFVDQRSPNEAQRAICFKLYRA